MRRLNSKIGYVSVYDFDFELAKTKTDIYVFENADLMWLDFVTANRHGENLLQIYDMHIGPVADDNVYQSIRLFETGVLDEKETIRRLKTEVLQNQWVFHSEKVLSFVTFIKTIEITEES